jgi:predicted oxidoreductase
MARGSGRQSGDDRRAGLDELESVEGGGGIGAGRHQAIYRIGAASPGHRADPAWSRREPIRLDGLVDADAIVVGAGLAGLAATAELARAGRRVLLLDQEPESNLGGQAFWSFGGLFLVDSPEQHRMGISERQIVARDREIDNPFTKDLQVMAIRSARRFRGDRLARTAAPHKILDPKAGPLIAVRLNILTRKTLGGLQTDLSGRVIGRVARGGNTTGTSPVPGLFAAGEVAGFGGGGMHGYRSLEGSFLGGCLFSGRQAGRAAARETAS